MTGGEILPSAVVCEPFAQIQVPVILNAHGWGWLPDAWRQGFTRYLRVENGLAVAWAPMPELDSILISIGAGAVGTQTSDQIAACMTRRGLRELVADLQSIDAQMESAP